jgi:hypothetical protein
VRQPLSLQRLADTSADLSPALRGASLTAPISLVSLTPTLQLEHVRIQT